MVIIWPFDVRAEEPKLFDDMEIVGASYRVGASKGQRCACGANPAVHALYAVIETADFLSRGLELFQDGLCWQIGSSDTVRGQSCRLP